MMGKLYERTGIVSLQEKSLKARLLTHKKAWGIMQACFNSFGKFGIAYVEKSAASRIDYIIHFSNN